MNAPGLISVATRWITCVKYLLVYQRSIRATQIISMALPAKRS